MKKIAGWLSGMEGSGTLAIKAKALELKASGRQIIEFTAGEPDFPTPDKIKKAAIEAINNNFTYYTQTEGIPSLKDAIIEKFAVDNNLTYNKNQVIVTAGAKHAIYQCLMVLLDKGDEVLVPAPYWVSYTEQVKMVGGIPVLIDTFDNGFKVTPEQIEKAITPKTRAILFNSPSNPTGAIYSHRELEQIKEVLKDKDIWIISDEIYEKIVFDNLSHSSLAGFKELFDKVIVINGLSKAYSMTGWRIGYAAGPELVIKEMKKIQGHQTSNVNSITQAASVVGLREVKDEIEMMRAEFENRRNVIYDYMSKWKNIEVHKPQGAFYILPDFRKVMKNLPGIENDSRMVEYLIEKAGVVAVPGSMFGAPGFIRFSFATSMADIHNGMKKISDVLN